MAAASKAQFKGVVCLNLKQHYRRQMHSQPERIADIRTRRRPHWLCSLNVKRPGTTGHMVSSLLKSSQLLSRCRQDTSRSNHVLKTLRRFCDQYKCALWWKFNSTILSALTLLHFKATIIIYDRRKSQIPTLLELNELRFCFNWNNFWNYYYLQHISHYIF